MRKVERLALCSANSRNSLKGEVRLSATEKGSTLLCLKLPLTLPCFVLAVHENYIIKKTFGILEDTLHCSELIQKNTQTQEQLLFGSENEQTKKAVRIFCKKQMSSLKNRKKSHQADMNPTSTFSFLINFFSKGGM